MNLRNFFAELKRRNVYRVAVADGIVGWPVVQIAATVVPALQLPGAVTSAVVLLTILGFPIALILAWAFELTPEGIKRTEDVAPSDGAAMGQARAHQGFLERYFRRIGEDPALAAIIVDALEIPSHRPAAIARLEEVSARHQSAGKGPQMGGLFALLKAEKQAPAESPRP